MNLHSDIQEVLYSYSCLVLVTVSLTCAAFRRWHICSPCADNPDHYYPARHQVCAFFLWNLLYLPVLIRPGSKVAAEYASCVELILIAAIIPAILIKYFKPEHMAVLRRSALYYTIPLTLTGIVGVVVTICPDRSAGLLNIFKIFTGTIAIAGCTSLAFVQKWLNKKIDNYHLNEFSNEDDFPYHFAKKIVWTPWLAIMLCWIILFSASRPLMILTWLVMSALSVYYTVVILHPHRKMIFTVADTETDSHQEDTDNTPKNATEEYPASDYHAGADFRIASIRLHLIEICRQRYLEPHLTRRDIISEFDYGSRTLAGRIISQYGFYAMINTLRLEHTRLYAEAHPYETKESVAVNSGFKDRFAMRHAERKIGAGIPEMLLGFKPSVS